MDGLTLSEKTTIWLKLCNKIVDRYEVLGGFNLLDYAHDMQVLKNVLSQWRGKHLGDDQRLIFTLYDTEFYYQDSKIGFDIFNLLRALIDLDISIGHCLLFTNHYGYRRVINRFCRQEGQTHSIQVFENSFCFLHTSDCVKDLPADPDTIKKQFAFLSNVRRDHRNYIRLFIEDRKLNDQVLMAWNPQGLMSWNPPRGEFERAEEAKNSGSISDSSVFVNTKPFVRNKNKIPFDQDLSLLFEKHKISIERYHRDPLLELGPNENNFETDFLQTTFVNIVAESVFEYPFPYITEKTFKCFWSQRPFLLVGPAGCLKALRNHGFQTFGDYWDETYDTQTNPIQRLKHLFSVIDEISKWSLDTCKKVYNHMQPVLEHNRQRYHSYLCGKMFDDLVKKLDCK